MVQQLHSLLISVYGVEESILYIYTSVIKKCPVHHFMTLKLHIPNNLGVATVNRDQLSMKWIPFKGR